MIFSIVCMKLFELNMFELDISIKCRHLRDLFLLVRATYVTFVYRIADNGFIDCILDETM